MLDRLKIVRFYLELQHCILVSPSYMWIVSYNDFYEVLCSRTIEIFWPICMARDAVRPLHVLTLGCMALVIMRQASSCMIIYTVEPPNKGHFGSGAFVLYSEAVLWWEVQINLLFLAT